MVSSRFNYANIILYGESKYNFRSVGEQRTHSHESQLDLTEEKVATPAVETPSAVY